MKPHAWYPKVLLMTASFSVVAGWYCCALAHHTDVHGSATNNLTQQAVDASEVSFYSTDVTWMKQGAVDEDVKGHIIADLGIPYRTMDHHYNPHTGSGKVGDPAVSAALDRWTNKMTPAFSYSSRRWLGDESDGMQGSMHALGRVLHLLQDMASPPHVHAPDGHGSFGPAGPGGNAAGFYSDFEEKWSPDSSVYAGWGYPAVTDGALTPAAAISVSIPNSRLEPESLTEVRACLSAIPSSERNKINGYMKAMAWLTYFHTSFYGQINKDENNPAPVSSNSNRTNILRTMFPNRISFHGDLLDDYWTIDGVGYYEKKLQYFPDDWWPCPGTYPIGKKQEGSGTSWRILGRFYIYMHYYRVETIAGGAAGSFYKAQPPAKYPDGTNNSLDLAHYYGNVLLPLAARFGAGLLRTLFPEPSSLSYPSSSSTGQYTVSWGTVPSTDAGSPIGYKLERSRNGGSWTEVYSGPNRSHSENVADGSYRYRVTARWFNTNPLYGVTRTGTSECVVGTYTPPPPPESTTAYVYVSQDQWANLWSGVPTTNGASATNIVVYRGNPNSVYGLLKFDLSGLRKGTTINSATLELDCNRDDGNAEIALFKCSGSWTQSTVSWNNKPAIGSRVEWASSSGIGRWTFESSQLRDLVQSWVDGSSNDGLYLIANGTVDHMVRFSSGHSLVPASEKPKLIYNYTEPPLPDLIITGLHPDPAPSARGFQVGQSVSWDVTVKNESSGWADSSVVGYYLGTSPTDLSNRIATRTTGELDGAQSKISNRTYVFKESDLGTRYLVCKADCDGDLDEYSETNNTYAYGPFSVVPAPVFHTLMTSVTGGHGSISEGGSYPAGDVVAVTATPDAGYRVKSWIGTNDDTSTSNNNTVTMTSPKTVTVEFEPIPYTLSASVVGGHGSVSPMSQTYSYGQSASLLATPDTGYCVKAWSGTDDDTATSNTNTVTMTSDKTVTVEFELIPSGDGLVAHFPFDGDVQEVTGYSNDGINNGSTGTEDRFGEPNSARHFTNGQYVRVPRSAAIEPADAITVALWARLTDPNARELPILSKRYNVNSPLCNSYILQPNNAPDFNMVGAIIVGGSVVPAASSTAMEPHVWTHEALVYNGASLKVYQDGQLVAECPASGSLDYSSDDLYIGMATPARSEQHWEGDIDDVRIYNRALSASEVQELSGRTLAIGGVVYTDRANPMATGLTGVTMTVTGSNGVYETVTSGTAGLWQISDVHEGSYTVTPSKTGWEFEHVLAGVPDGQSSTVIEVNDANQATIESIQFLAEEVGVRLHDWNGDGIVSIVGDVPPFVQCVYFGNCPDGVGTIDVGDCNDDGILSIVGDVPCFVQCVYFNNCPE